MISDYDRIPEWVTALPPEDENKEVLTQLALAGEKPLGTPREIVFTIWDIHSVKNAERIKDLLKSKGWTVWISEDMAHGPTYKLEAAQNDFIISESNINSAEKFFKEIALSINSVYEGWHAQVV